MFKETEGPETPTLGRGTKTEKEVGVCGLPAGDIFSFPLRENLAKQWRWYLIFLSALTVLAVCLNGYIIKHIACLFQGWSQTEILRYALSQCQSCLKMLMQHDIEENLGFYLHGRKL